MVAQSFFRLAYNGLRLGEVGDLTKNVNTKHALQIYKKLPYEALHRQFCQTAVIGCGFLSSAVLFSGRGVY